MTMSKLRIPDAVSAQGGMMRMLRRDLHKHPELAFCEYRTAGRVAEQLKALGLDVYEGIGGTGVVARLRRGSSGRAIGLRADMDALPMNEIPGRPHGSVHAGSFHGCGHDGHTAMLLGAAKALSEEASLDGEVVFIFQPAEEGEGGAVAMIEDGLFERFPVEAVFGLHNWPRLPLGSFGVRSGPMMAAFDKFDITISGKGGHAGLPHESTDPVLASAATIQGLQSVISRNTDPAAPAVVSVTRIEGGSAYNVIPDRVKLSGCTRYFDDETGATIRQRTSQLTNAISEAYGTSAEVSFTNVYCPLVNHPDETRHCIRAAEQVAPGYVDADHGVIMGSEDFAFMLHKIPGCYILMGTGTGSDDPMLHNPAYDFNDDALVIGAGYWVELVRTKLGRAS